MASRMEKYHDDEQQRVSSRLERNKQKYDDFKSMAYKEFPSISEMTIPTKFIDKDEPFNSDSYDNYKSRRTRSNNLEKTSKLEEKKMPYSFLDDDKEDYDINSVLKRARENRNKEDELDYKRKLRTSEYNILEGLDQEKLEKIVQKKKEMYRDGEESDIKELINTITSNSLSNKVNEKLKEDSKREIEVEGEGINDNDDLLSELLPDRIDETIITEAISEDMIEEYEPSVENEEKEELDTSFYTKSMDLSEHDLVNEINETNDELDTSFVEGNSQQLFFKVLSVVLVVVVVAVVLFIVYNACKVK